MIPFEFSIEGPPVSSQTKNRKSLRAWKGRVHQAAEALWPQGTPPVPDDVTVKITYFYDNEPPDVNNIIKPIQDALIGLVYHDDGQVADTSSRKSKIDGAFIVKGVSPELAVRLAAGRDFVWVRVLPEPAHEELL